MRRAGIVLGSLVLAALAAPATASAHGIVQREDLPIPHVVFAWAVAGVLVVSFVALGALWPRPRLERPPWRPLPGGRVLGSTAWDVVLGLVGIGLLAVVLGAGWVAGGTALDNLAPTFILITFWVGLAFASVLLGDVFALLSPWRALGRGTGWVVRRVTGRAPRHLAYPERVGRYPATLVLLIFAWIELVSGWGDAPATLASAAAGYTVIALVGQAVYGVEAWNTRAEGFAVYYNLLSRISIWERRDERSGERSDDERSARGRKRSGRGRILGVRPPLGGLTRLDHPPGTVAFVLTTIGTVTFDGLGQGPAWSSLRGVLVDGFTAIGVSAEAAPKWASTVGLVACVALIAGFYRLGISGARSVGGKLGEPELRERFIHTLAPIAAVYVFAHYFSFLLFEGQGIIYLASDPFGQGWNLFGTATTGIDYSLISQTGTWYVQVAFVCLGHVAALTLAHDRALVLYDDVKLAVRSQYWMLGVMVGFTSLALWLLAQAGA